MDILLKQAEACGFDHTGPLCCSSLRFYPEVREMCAADKCKNYGRSWSCPPACGTLEEIAEKASGYQHGILVQSTGQLEDDFDFEAILATEQLHKQRFYALVEQARQQFPHCLPMASGACTQCSSCSYPDAPCRNPDRAIPSMEAYGLLVSEVCEKSNLRYYYGPGTITFTVCILV